MSAGGAAAAPEVSGQPFWRGRLALSQPPRGGGYRFSLDAVLLAGFCPPARRALDLGAGCGIIGLLLLASRTVGQVVAVERLPAMAALARRNARANRLAGRLHVVEADLRGRKLGKFDLVVFNPPFFAAAAGSPSPDAGRDAARHERAGTLADFVARAAVSVAGHGSVAVVVRVQRAAELAALMARWRLWPVATRQVVARAGQPAGLHLALFGRHPGVVRRRSPWVLHPAVGPERYAAGVRGWLEAGSAPPSPRPRCRRRPRPRPGGDAG